jgi:hypothetical protein
VVRPRISIAGMMIAVAVIAFDSFLLIMTEGVGILLVGLTLTIGIVCWWRGRGKGKRFWLGFEAAGLAAVLAYIGCVEASGGLILRWPVRLPYVIELCDSLSASGPLNGDLVLLILFEVFFGIPMLLIASIGGLLATLTSGGASAMRTPRVRITIYWLMAAVAALALTLGLGVAALRCQDLNLTNPDPLSIRVFNRTSTPLDHLNSNTII